ncbi:carboxypeptidase-like regulatory domain-containing protein [Chitinispirillales bacterium ANBcel5]|uniref:carboxypeptidase regulatory-like domain-containing protein n=1 Tax=Cellulosispirillum alkaliphilum TaxID=3039283 RepID=UPI002A56F0D7|nr:carboxypeptidase-like regulatory domain-containing protein [Chitinispirillales bacterium ANBcel5]
MSVTAIKLTICMLCTFCFVSAQNSTINGIITNNETDSPVTEAKVVLTIRTATGYGGVNFFERIDSVFTDETGEYSFTELAAGFYVVAVSGGGYQSQTKSTDLSNNQNSIINFSLTPTSGTSAGTLVLVVRSAGDSSGIEGVTVVVQADDYQADPSSKFTDSDGSVTFSDMIAGSYTINISKEGYSDRSHKIDLGENVTYTVNVYLGQASSVWNSPQTKGRNVGRDQTGTVFTLNGRKAIHSSSGTLPASSSIYIRSYGDERNAVRDLNLR